MKHLFFLISLILCYSYGTGQTLLWSDDFEATASDWDLTITPGTNGSEANIWEINDNEGGVVPPGCGTASNGDKTLHVTCSGAPCTGTGAIYNKSSGAGVDPITDIRAALTNPINTTSETNLELVFDWMGIGQTNQDFAELEYSIDGGLTWNSIWTQTPGTACGTAQAEWTEETVSLPIAAENQGDLRFAFHWVNDDDGNGDDPSFAVNNLRLNSLNSPSGNPTADFTTPSFTICENDCIDFTDASTGTNISSWDWSFNGADTPTSNNQNPTNICYSTAGSYNVTLEITDDNGTDSKTLQVTVNDCATAPTAGFIIDSSTVCEGDCISFTDLSAGDPTSWEWTFDGGTPHTSTEQNPSDICFDSSGTYSVTLKVTNSSGVDQIINPVNVLDLPVINGFGDTLIEMGGAAELEAVPVDAGDLFWEPDEHIDCPTCLNVVATPLITTTYYPSLIDANGCVGEDTVVVSVDFEEIVEVPSAFSPNGDGVNDSLHVLGVGITNINFKIYNRYGQLVFSTDNINEGWDGTMHGKVLNQGVFAYTLEYDLVNGAHGEKSGNVTLVK